MPTLIMTFPARRFHATPWGHHVNEGLIEWPPSPWRLIRALLCVGYTKGQWGDDGPPAHARNLFAKLTSVLPVYSMPKAVGAHSRHYMPLASLKNARENTTLVFDTWAHVDCGQLAISWDVELNEDEQLLLAELAAKLSYLGRAESWVEARLALENESVPPANCHPCDSPPERGWEQVALLAPLSDANYSEWRQLSVNKVLAGCPPGEQSGKRPSKKDEKILAQREKALEPFPSALLDALQKDTSWQRSHGWSQPPGSQRVFYWRRIDSLEIGPPVGRTVQDRSSVQLMLLSMATATGNKHALPSVIYTLIHGERLHKALVAAAGDYNCVLSGCDEAGNPLLGQHEHAHFLPLDLDSDGHLDHFAIWAPMGIDDAAQKAVRTLRKTYAKNIKSLYLALAATCEELKELRTLSGLHGEKLGSIFGLNGSTEWISHAPFVPPRFLKPRGKNSLHGQVQAELQSRGLPAPVDVSVIDPRDNPTFLRHRHFTRARKNGFPPPVDCGFTLKLVFETPVYGPLCLGYGSHYGLGLFAAVD
ncbi:MAG TPA: type I-U CRISPR-associated protein Csb2 [Dissulfurispiraceae bacterium]|nr:type I-U CRISPR-associated protein Csb2 [Dissulfurispiraceae bacterium]